jgi:hypothetical protein
MSEHTPGPWTAYCRDVNHEEGKPWPKDQFLQWEVSGPEVPDGRGEFYEADARLVAAAPELLEALQFMLDSEVNGWDILPAQERAKAALSKARGELFNTKLKDGHD